MATEPDVVAESDGSIDPLHPFRAELRAHCYRMLGSVDDADDVLQEVSVRAWGGRAGFEGRSSLRTWLHRIANNACLNELARNERRVLPIDLGPATDKFDAVLHRNDEVRWLQPLAVTPEDQVVNGETVELAFVAALQHLSPNERAALIMFDVLNFSANDVAHALGTTRAR